MAVRLSRGDGRRPLRWKSWLAQTPQNEWQRHVDRVCAAKHSTLQHKLKYNSSSPEAKNDTMNGALRDCFRAMIYVIICVFHYAIPVSSSLWCSAAIWYGGPGLPAVTNHIINATIFHENSIHNFFTGNKYFFFKNSFSMGEVIFKLCLTCSKWK